MEFLQQDGYTQTETKLHHGKTLVISRLFEDRGSQWMGDSNQDRRESAMSLNRKSASQQMKSTGGHVPSNSTSRPKPRPRRREPSSPPAAEDLVEKWKQKSQLEDGDTSDDDNARLLGLSGTSKGGRAGKASSSKTKSSYASIKKIRLTLSPELRTKSLPATSKNFDDDDDNDPYWLSQDGVVSSSAPRKDLRVEVSIGHGDGESIASASSIEAFPPPARAAGKKKKRKVEYELNGEKEMVRKLFSFGRKPRFGEDKSESESESESESDDNVVVVQKKGKGKEVAKGKKVEPVETKKVEAKSKARQEDRPTSGKSSSKTKLSITKTGLLKTNSTKRANDTSSKRKIVLSPVKKALPAKKAKRITLEDSEPELESPESDVSDTPRPKKRDIARPGKASGKQSARRERTPPTTAATGTGIKRKRTFADDPTDFFSGYDSSSRAAPRKKHAAAIPRTPEKRGAEPKSKRGKGREKVGTTTTMKEKSKTTAKEKERPVRFASPKGFPAPMRAPVRVNEALLSSQYESGSQPEQPKKRYRQNAYGEKEEIVLGPNG